MRIGPRQWWPLRRCIWKAFLSWCQPLSIWSSLILNGRVNLKIRDAIYRFVILLRAERDESPACVTDKISIALSRVPHSTLPSAWVYQTSPWISQTRPVAINMLFWTTVAFESGRMPRRFVFSEIGRSIYFSSLGDTSSSISSILVVVRRSLSIIITDSDPMPCRNYFALVSRAV